MGDWPLRLHWGTMYRKGALFILKWRGCEGLEGSRNNRKHIKEGMDRMGQKAEANGNYGDMGREIGEKQITLTTVHESK